jgi:2-polyprenyl-3-methyl-5-hydroxy-6-metoxy-1,4-benzoquinol methylase
MPDITHPPAGNRTSPTEGRAPAGTAHFDQAAITWEDNPVRRQLNDAVTAAIIEAIPLRPDWTVLEYGCGTAALSRRLAPQVSRVLAMDASAGMIAEAAKFATAQGLANLATRQLDLLREPPPEERFDLIVSAMTLHHVTDTSLLFRRLHSLLRPGGQMALADLFPEDGSFHDDPEIPHHGFDPASLADILAGLGLADAVWREIHRIEKNGFTYPVFLLTAHG